VFSIGINAALFALFSLLIVTTTTAIKITEIYFEIKCQQTENIFPNYN